MVGETVEVGTIYRIGPEGVTVRMLSGVTRILPADRIFEFGQPGTVIEGTLVALSGRKQRRSYADKMQRRYENKGRT